MVVFEKFYNVQRALSDLQNRIKETLDSLGSSQSQKTSDEQRYVSQTPFGHLHVKKFAYFKLHSISHHQLSRRKVTSKLPMVVFEKFYNVQRALSDLQNRINETLDSLGSSKS